MEKRRLILVALTLLVLVTDIINVTARPAPDRRKLQASATPLIVGGVVINTNRYPYAVAVFSKTRPFCSGVLIHPSVVMTAGHCAEKGDVYGVKVGVRNWLMDDIRGNTYHARRVTKAIIHPEYAKNNDRRWKYSDILGDIALLVLNKPVPSTWPTIKLPTAKNTTPKKFTVIGFGATDEYSSSMSKSLREVSVDFIERSKCTTLLNKEAPGSYSITDSSICAGVLAGGKDACFGDSGGPMFGRGTSPATDILFGLTSFGEGCARKNVPAGYTNVRKYVPWVQSTMKKLKFPL